MRRLCLVHWDIAEAEQKVPALRTLGYEVECAAPEGYPGLRPLRDAPPDVVVIDLSRRPAYGRDIAQALRRYKDTRNVPLVLLGGQPEKVAPIRERLPDAVYADWGGAAGALRDALSRAQDAPVVPPSPMDGYSGTPLPGKLGLKPASTVALLGAPDGFEQTLGDLPDGLSLSRGDSGPRDVALWFVRSRAELEGEVGRMSARLGGGRLWIIWPKKASGMRADVTQQLVREAGLAAGLVDYKVCSVDATWSGLLFARRKGQGGR